jgi:hypothetical protein
VALIERTAYPRFAPRPSARELARLYTPNLREEGLAVRATRGGKGQILAFLVMLKSFQRLGYFPKPEEVPEAVVSHLRSRLGLPEDVPATPPRRSRQRYRDAIREHLCVNPYGDDARRVAVEAVAKAAATMDDPADLVNVAVEGLVKERFELPAFSALDRLVRKVRHAGNSRLFSRVDEGLSAADRERFDGLLVADAWGRSDLNLLKAAPNSATSAHLKELQERLLWLESFGDTDRLLSGIPNQKVANLAAQARALDASELKDVGDERRRAMLVCLLHRSKVASRDGLAEMLVKTVARLHNRGREDLEELHQRRRAATEGMLDLLGEIVEGARRLEGDAALGRRVRELLSERGGPDRLAEEHEALMAYKMSVARISGPQLLDAPLRPSEQPVDVEGVGVRADLGRDPGNETHQRGRQRLAEPELAL